MKVYQTNAKTTPPLDTSIHSFKIIRNRPHPCLAHCLALMQLFRLYALSSAIILSLLLLCHQSLNCLVQTPNPASPNDCLYLAKRMNIYLTNSVSHSSISLIMKIPIRMLLTFINPYCSSFLAFSIINLSETVE